MTGLLVGTEAAVGVTSAMTTREERGEERVMKEGIREETERDKKREQEKKR